MIDAVIVDDDVTTLDGLARMVNWTQLGIRIAATAKNGQEGLAHIRKFRPQLVLTDLFMPVMDGIEMIRALRAEGGRAEVIILSGYEDFKYAQSAVKLQVTDYLSKPATLDEIEEVLGGAVARLKAQEAERREEEELRELLESHRPLTRRQLLQGLLEPGFAETDSCERFRRYLQLDWSGQYFSVLRLEVLGGRSRPFGGPGDDLPPPHALAEYMELKSVVGQRLYVADAQRSRYTVLIALRAAWPRSSSDRRMQETALALIGELEQEYGLQVAGALGMSVEAAADIWRSYEGALALIAQREELPHQKLLTEADKERLARETQPRLSVNVQSVVTAALAGQRETTLERIGELARSLSEQEPAPTAAVKEYVLKLVALLTLALQEQGMQLEDVVPGFSTYKTLDRMVELRDFVSWLPELLLPVSEAMGRRHAQKHVRTIDYMMRYVEQHYAEDITLDLLADKVYLTRNYLSQIFKQGTGENFNGYVTRIRMEKARELMLSGRYKVSEISRMVGYKNNAYFSQLFKKHTGLSPSEVNQ
ncbi:two-component system, response regulator YesN [Paenibacillus sp. UNCCL117]|uniref:response regulator transcription factor n=1 Tax=unclassified Paenibacillus TaxID=185978 RepID=UPI00087E999A|nr:MULTISPECIES: response regulator [unclassified Paenibacillus]SDD69003.1 two-component system, response regulator YesN [Paenibacillus sp. cl123]SFW45053.1 two-component system, response regulator YesN [Paenibacillus sp. UNCCL117]